MKYLFSIILTVLSLSIVNARGGGGGHSSGGHSSGSHSFGSHSGGTHSTSHNISHGTSKASTGKTTVRSYTRVTHVEPSEIHTYPIGYSHPNFLYYYLLMNHNTNTYDTIQSNSQDDLTAQVTEISDEDDGPMSTAEIVAIILISAFVVFLFIIWAKEG